MTRQMPSPGEYTSILMNMQLVRVQELQSYKPELTRLGQPLVYSGGFAITAPITGGAGKKKALRFYTRLPDDMAQRYRVISRFINSNLSSGVFARTDYYETGVAVNGEIYPICVMEWLDGVTLRKYISKHINSPAKINTLADKFKTMMNTLKRLGAAHGDLSHENIMMVNDEMKLVDYDGIYTRDLHGMGPCVAGQQNFQHPERVRTGGYFGPYQDDFSAIALYISLLALQKDPSLYERYDQDGACLLFHKSDFENPDASPYMKELEQYPDLQPMVEGFRQICRGSIRNVPSLSEFLRGNYAVASRAIVSAAPLPANLVFDEGNTPVFNASSLNQKELRESVGHVGTIAGKVGEVEVQTDYMILKFSTGLRQASFAYIVGDAMQEILKTTKNPETKYSQEFVKVTGPIQLTEITQDTFVPSVETDALQDVSIIPLNEFTKLTSGIEATPTERIDWDRKEIGRKTGKSVLDKDKGSFGNNIFDPDW